MTTPRSIRSRSVFIDTSAFYALLDRRDRWTAEAEQQFRAITADRRPIVTSNLVVAETYTLARGELGYSIATRWLEGLDLNLIFETEHDHAATAALLARYSDKDFSYADASSFVLMERLGITIAFTFDAHFRQYGVQVVP